MIPQRKHSNSSATIDTLAGVEAISVMLASHIAAVKAAQGAVVEINRAAGVVADALEAGATICYAAAGSSGLMALADACELPGTFRIPQSQIRICIAGGVPIDGCMPGDTEDNEGDATEAADAMCQGDVAIVLSASGTTPFALSFAQTALSKGACLIGIANVPNSALLGMADVSVALDTATEVVEGSTRLGAGTAQKVALNMVSTQAGVLMGHVHDGLMVNLHPENRKLRLRAIDIVSRIAGVSALDARKALNTTNYDTKLAALVAMGENVAGGEILLDQHRGRLHSCLQAMSERADSTEQIQTERRTK